MKTEIKLIFDKHHAGDKLDMGDIHALMGYALELMNDFERLTKESTARFHKRIGE